MLNNLWTYFEPWYSSHRQNTLIPPDASQKSHPCMASDQNPGCHHLNQVPVQLIFLVCSSSSTVPFSPRSGQLKTLTEMSTSYSSLCSELPHNLLKQQTFTISILVGQQFRSGFAGWVWDSVFQDISVKISAVTELPGGLRKLEELFLGSLSDRAVGWRP